MKTYKITYADDLSGGAERSTFFSGTKTRQEIIEFFGLRNPDIHWYKIEEVNEDLTPKKETQNNETD